MPGWISHPLGLGRVSGRRHGAGENRANPGAVAAIAGSGRTASRALLVCPTSLLGNWRKEASRFTPQLAVMTHHGAGRDKDETFVSKHESTRWCYPATDCCIGIYRCSRAWNGRW
jgi:hypothetical protein